MLTSWTTTRPKQSSITMPSQRMRRPTTTHLSWRHRDRRRGRSARSRPGSDGRCTPRRNRRGGGGEGATGTKARTVDGRWRLARLLERPRLMGVGHVLLGRVEGGLLDAGVDVGQGQREDFGRRDAGVVHYFGVEPQNAA